MDERIKNIDAITASLAKKMQGLTGAEISITPDSSNPLCKFVPLPQLRMLEVGLFAEAEMLKAFEAKAFFAACLAGAAMNEALLTLMCLMFQNDVIATQQYQSSKTEKKLRNKNFEQIIARWQLQQLINVAQELLWIPSAVVRDEIKRAFADGYREVVAITHPEYSKEHVDETAESFYGEEAGAALLTFTQEIRNLIHSGKWLRNQHGFNSGIFSRWCEFAVHVFGEVRTCLMSTLSIRNYDRLAAQLAETERKVEGLPEELQVTFRSIVNQRFNQS